MNPIRRAKLQEQTEAQADATRLEREIREAIEQLEKLDFELVDDLSLVVGKLIERITVSKEAEVVDLTYLGSLDRRYAWFFIFANRYAAYLSYR